MASAAPVVLKHRQPLRRQRIGRRRRTLGAGILPNNRGTLAGWIADSQGIKPGNRMPSYPVLTGQDLRAVSAYLESLK